MVYIEYSDEDRHDVQGGIAEGEPTPKRPMHYQSHWRDGDS